ncbi:hypothetical protein [Methylorubrum extorquens]
MSALVDFLRTFGPIATSDSLCDENLRETQATFSVASLDTPAPRANDLHRAILGASPINVILTGTAGDGKTYHIRQFFMATYKERAAEWPGEEGVLRLPLPDGRELRVIRDLSEVSDSEKAAELRAFTAALLGETPERIYLVAANDGQLLKYFRDAAAQEGTEAARAQVLHQRLSEMLREEREHRDDLKLHLINLSRTWSEAVVDSIFDAVLEHPSWDYECDKCPSLASHSPCPIRLNRSLLRNGEGGETVFRKRIKEALRLAAANDQHIPIRQLLTLVVNIILGDSNRPDDPLLDCASARLHAQARRYATTNPYNNAVGLNLRTERRRANRVFNVFEVLAVGFETNNLIDSALVQNQPAELYEALFNDDLVYGRDLFEPLRDAYFKCGGVGTSGASDATIRAFRLGLEAQRRRAFFRLPSEGAREMARPWRLSIFQHGGDYLKLLAVLKEGAVREAVDPFTRQLLRGLNRAFTGMMAADEERLWFAGTIGKTDNVAGRIATLEPIERTSATYFNVRLALDLVGRPCLRVMPPRMAPQRAVSELPLRPLLFEYLMRVASGSLPSSFSRQCHQEIRHFALVTQTAMQRMMASDEDQPQVVRILTLGGRGEIQAQPLEV